MKTSMNRPSDGYYLMAGQQISDGPFSTLEGAADLLLTLCPIGCTPPERLGMVMACMDAAVLDLVKDENGEVINGDLVQSREMDYWASLSKRRPEFKT